MMGPTKPRSANGNTGLMRGDASRIARIHRMSRQHVLEVARGTRQTPNAKLRATIERYRAKARRLQRPGDAPTPTAA
jgi:hypothetical protein